MEVISFLDVLVFYLDDVTLSRASCVCKKWRLIVREFAVSRNVVHNSYLPQSIELEERCQSIELLNCNTQLLVRTKNHTRIFSIACDDARLVSSTPGPSLSGESDSLSEPLKTRNHVEIDGLIVPLPRAKDWTLMLPVRHGVLVLFSHALHLVKVFRFDLVAQRHSWMRAGRDRLVNLRNIVISCQVEHDAAAAILPLIETCPLFISAKSMWTRGNAQQIISNSIPKLQSVASFRRLLTNFLCVAESCPGDLETWFDDFQRDSETESLWELTMQCTLARKRCWFALRDDLDGLFESQFSLFRLEIMRAVVTQEKREHSMDVARKSSSPLVSSLLNSAVAIKMLSKFSFVLRDANKYALDAEFWQMLFAPVSKLFGDLQMGDLVQDAVAPVIKACAAADASHAEAMYHIFESHRDHMRSVFDQVVADPLVRSTLKWAKTIMDAPSSVDTSRLVSSYPHQSELWEEYAWAQEAILDGAHVDSLELFHIKKLAGVM